MNQGSFRRFLLVLGLVMVVLLPASAQMQTTIMEPNAAPAGVSTPVSVRAQIDSAVSITPGSVRLERLNADGQVIAILGALHDDGVNGDLTAGDSKYSLSASLYSTLQEQWRFQVSAGVVGKIARIKSDLILFSFFGGANSSIKITSPANLTFTSVPTVVVKGTVADPAASVKVNNLPAAVVNSQWTVQVPLMEGNNPITAVATSGNAVNQDVVQVNLDTTAPRVTISAPENASSTNAASVQVSGLVNDVVVGTVNDQNVTVRVNGVIAAVSNRSYLATVPLALGNNTIQAVGVDRVGNTNTTVATVTRVAPANARIELVSGGGQSGIASSVLAQPLLARVVNAQNQPVANAAVVFDVTRGNGLVNNLSSAVALTNSLGQAQVQFKLGSRSGAGNHQVDATAPGYQGTATFLESATPAAASRIVVDSGGNQTGLVAASLPLPFIAIVTDANFNRLAGVPVTFTVIEGGGLIDAKTAYATVTDSDGRAMAILTLGGTTGNSNNRVDATFAGNGGPAAVFVASAKVPGPLSETQITGTVLDNSNNPLPNVTMRLYQTNQGNNNSQPLQIGTPVLTNAAGFFRMKPVPVGLFKVMADGSTAGDYPTLEYDVLTVSGADNTLGTPVYLPKLNPANKACVDQNTGGTVTMQEAPGFSLKILPGSATFPGGSKSGCVTVSLVNGDKVPMAPGFGQQPRFIVTIQPVGTKFNPPASITIPNVDGLPPNAVTEMYSYDHDLASFVAIGTGTVSEDGSRIAADPGVGVIKAGWHCGGNPNSTGSVGTCPDCQKCVGTNCQVDNSKSCNDGKFCTSCAGGQTPGGDCCKDGTCTGKKMADQDDTTITPKEYDITKIIQAINDGVDAVTKFDPTQTCKPNKFGAKVGIKLTDTKSCCEAAQGLVSASKYGGYVSLDAPLGGSCQFPTPLTVPGVAGINIKVGFSVGGQIGATGYSYSNPACGDCSWSIDYKANVSVSGGVVGYLGNPNIVRLEGLVKAEGSVSGKIDCNGFSPVKGCAGPLSVEGSFVIANGLGGSSKLSHTFNDLKFCI
jgi:hypothetical protein